MKIKELRTMHVSELQEKLGELRVELMKERAQIALGSAPKNPGRVRAVKRNIARIITLVHQDQIKKNTEVKKHGKDEVTKRDV